jgi:hypothetical protein
MILSRAALPSLLVRRRTVSRCLMSVKYLRYVLKRYRVCAMRLTELQQAAELRSWDWLRDLRDDERSISWLARKTGMSTSSVHAYAYGHTTPPLEWLIKAVGVLRPEWVDFAN